MCFFTEDYLSQRRDPDLQNDVDIIFRSKYLSPSILKFANSDSIRDGTPILEFIEWGLRARGIFTDEDLEYAFRLGKLTIKTIKVIFYILMKRFIHISVLFPQSFE